MACRFRLVAASLLLIVIFESLSNASAETTLRELMEKDLEARRQAELGVSPTPSAATSGNATSTTAASAKDKKKDEKGKSKKDKKDEKDKKDKKDKKDEKDKKDKKDEKGKDKKDKKDEKKAAAAVAAPAQAAPQKQSNNGGQDTGGATLSTSALVGIGVGVGVACLVAVGSVIGVLVHLRRRKRNASSLEKQKTYGGTE